MKLIPQGKIKDIYKLLENTLIIEKDRHVYTEEYIELVKGFYLKL